MADAQQAETQRLFQVLRTLSEMLTDRGYTVPDQLKHITQENFAATFGHNVDRDNLTYTERMKNDPTKFLCIFFPKNPKLGVTDITNCVDKMKNAGAQRGIVVYSEKITPFAKQHIQMTCNGSDRPDGSEGVTIELFKESELLVNITKHHLVPQHIVLTNEEKSALLQKYKLTDAQLPRVQKDDPVSRYYGLKKGQVVKIIRPSETAGRYVTYRIVY